MTMKLSWGDFKKKVEAEGVTDDMPVSYIDWSGVAAEPKGDEKAVIVEHFPSGEFAVYG